MKRNVDSSTLQQVRVDAPVGGHRAGRPWARGELRVGDDRRGRVPRQVDLRARWSRCARPRARRCAARPPGCRSRRTGAAGRWPDRCRAARRARRHAPGADLGQARVLRDLEPPALVVGQMPAEHVELVQRHPVDVAQDELRATGSGAPNRASGRASGSAAHPVMCSAASVDAALLGRRARAQLPQRHRPVEQARADRAP